MPYRDGEKPKNKQPASFATSFSQSLLDPKRKALLAKTSAEQKAAVSRYNVHRNNIAVSLIDALAGIFPAVHRITGSEFFREMARLHVYTSPPKSPLLFEYGRDFPDFIERYEYAESIPYLADTARIERAWLDAYHAADEASVNPELLRSIERVRLADLIFVPHPATRIVSSKFAALSIFVENRESQPTGTIDASRPEDALITRPGVDVFVRRLPRGGAVFLASLVAGKTLGEAASAAYASSMLFDLSANIAGMLEAGAFSGVREEAGDPADV